MSRKGAIDTTRTDKDYWNRVLDAEGLGMNRGTTFSQEDKSANQVERDEYKNNSKKKVKRGRPHKTGFEGQQLKFTRLNAIASTRFTRTSDEISGVFQLGGFRHHGPSTPFGAGRGKKGSRRGLSTSGAFIQYVGSAYDLARLEEALALEETGRVTPSGYGADR